MTLIVPMAVWLFDREGLKDIRYDLCLAWDAVIILAALSAIFS